MKRLRAQSLQWCPTLCNPTDYNPPGSSVPGEAMIQDGLPCPPPGDFPNPGIEPMSPALQADSLPTWEVYMRKLSTGTVLLFQVLRTHVHFDRSTVHSVELGPHSASLHWWHLRKQRGGTLYPVHPGSMTAKYQLKVGHFTSWVSWNLQEERPLPFPECSTVFICAL